LSERGTNADRGKARVSFKGARRCRGLAASSGEVLPPEAPSFDPHAEPVEAVEPE